MPRARSLGSRFVKLVMSATGPPGRLGQPARYLIVASVTMATYFGVLTAALALRAHYLVAILLAQVLTIGLAFPAYRHWVFGPGHTLWRDFLRFLAVWAGGAVSGFIATPILVEFASWSPMLAQAAAIVVVGGASFLAHRLFSFRRIRQKAFRQGPEWGY